jgi:hypothetical protein
MTARALSGAVLLVAMTGSAGMRPSAAVDAELRRETVAAFDRYVAETEQVQQQTLGSADRFLRVDRLDGAERTAALAALRAGEIRIERVETRAGGREIEIPGGLVHHWSGSAFVPGVHLQEAVRLLQDYDRHATVYTPAVVRSRVVEHAGDSFVVDLRFYQKHVIAVTLDTRNTARFTRHDPHRASSRIVSTRVAQVEDAGTPQERLLPEGRDSGYLWRLNTYWRFLERDGGTYVECESVTLTRGVPTGFGWLVGRYVNSIPRESLSFTLERTRDALVQTRASR